MLFSSGVVVRFRILLLCRMGPSASCFLGRRFGVAVFVIMGWGLLLACVFVARLRWCWLLVSVLGVYLVGLGLWLVEFMALNDLGWAEGIGCGSPVGDAAIPWGTRCIMYVALYCSFALDIVVRFWRFRLLFFVWPIAGLDYTS